jgi:hypothetical protein
VHATKRSALALANGWNVISWIVKREKHFKIRKEKESMKPGKRARDQRRAGEFVEADLRQEKKVYCGSEG